MDLFIIIIIIMHAEIKVTLSQLTVVTATVTTGAVILGHR